MNFRDEIVDTREKHNLYSGHSWQNTLTQNVITVKDLAIGSNEQIYVVFSRFREDLRFLLPISTFLEQFIEVEQVSVWKPVQSAPI